METEQFQAWEALAGQREVQDRPGWGRPFPEELVIKRHGHECQRASAASWDAFILLRRFASTTLTSFHMSHSIGSGLMEASC
jgi:hypothetical protein